MNKAEQCVKLFNADQRPMTRLVSEFKGKRLSPRWRLPGEALIYRFDDSELHILGQGKTHSMEVKELTK